MDWYVSFGEGRALLAPRRPRPPTSLLDRDLLDLAAYSAGNCSRVRVSVKMCRSTQQGENEHD